jgi:hypothetical protein
MGVRHVNSEGRYEVPCVWYTYDVLTDSHRSDSQDDPPRMTDAQRLRDETGHKMADCFQVLVVTGGDYEAARKMLRDKGITPATT